MHKTPAVSELSQQYPLPVPSDSGNNRVQHKSCKDLIGTCQRISKVGTTGCSDTSVLLLLDESTNQNQGAFVCCILQIKIITVTIDQVTGFVFFFICFPQLFFLSERTSSVSFHLGSKQHHTEDRSCMYLC